MKERKIIQSAKSWRDLDRTIKKLIKNKQTTLAGSIFEHLTKLYFEVSPEYKNKLKGFKEKPQDIPSNPRSYKDEFKGMGDWLGKKK